MRLPSCLICLQHCRKPSSYPRIGWRNEHLVRLPNPAVQHSCHCLVYCPQDVFYRCSLRMGHSCLLGRFPCSIALLYHAPFLPAPANLVIPQYGHYSVVPGRTLCWSELHSGSFRSILSATLPPAMVCEVELSFVRCPRRWHTSYGVLSHICSFRWFWKLGCFPHVGR